MIIIIFSESDFFFFSKLFVVTAVNYEKQVRILKSFWAHDIHWIYCAGPCAIYVTIWAGCIS